MTTLGTKDLAQDSLAIGAEMVAAASVFAE
jgi:hypothetical protein